MTSQNSHSNGHPRDVWTVTVKARSLGNRSHRGMGESFRSGLVPTYSSCQWPSSRCANKPAAMSSTSPRTRNVAMVAHQIRRQGRDRTTDDYRLSPASKLPCDGLHPAPLRHLARNTDEVRIHVEVDPSHALFAQPNPPLSRHHRRNRSQGKVRDVSRRRKADGLEHFCTVVRRTICRGVDQVDGLSHGGSRLYPRFANASWIDLLPV